MPPGTRPGTGDGPASSRIVPPRGERRCERNPRGVPWISAQPPRTSTYNAIRWPRTVHGCTSAVVGGQGDLVVTPPLTAVRRAPGKSADCTDTDTDTDSYPLQRGKLSRIFARGVFAQQGAPRARGLRFPEAGAVGVGVFTPEKENRTLEKF